MKKEITLSVMIPTYNHEKYIVKALDSVFMQETEYTYEVLVGEDASTDRTRHILKEYESKHNYDELHVFYREHNLRNGPISNQKDLRLRCRGKYIITLEGDDYWTDKNKIQRQISFLENHPDYVAVAHNCKIVNENDEPVGFSYPECKSNEYSLIDYLLGVMPGQTATVMSINYFKTQVFDLTVLDRNRGNGPEDRVKYFALASNGKIYCDQNKMSAYRLVTNHGSSFMANYRYNFQKDYLWHKNIVDFSHEQNKGVYVAEALYIGSLLHGMRRGEINKKEVLETVKQDLWHPVVSFGIYVFRWCAVRILGKGNQTKL